MESSFFMFRLGETWVIFDKICSFKGKYSLFYVYLTYPKLSEVEIYEVLTLIGFFYCNGFPTECFA